MTNLCKKTAQIIESKGWLSVARLEFDNGVTASVTSSFGFIAIDKTDGLCYFLGPNDSMISDFIRNTIIVSHNSVIDHLQNVVIQDMDCMQRCEFSTFTNYSTLTNGKTFPLPNILTKAQLDAVVDGEESYVLTYGTLEGEQVQVHKMYGECDDLINNPSQRIEFSKKFYVSQLIFKNAISAYFNIPIENLI